MQDPEDEARRAEEEMERMLMEQEAADEDHDDNQIGGDDDPMLAPEDPDAFQIHRSNRTKPKFQLSYTTVSFASAAILLWYALRTRYQWYLALVF
jgi:hypothetical protein